MLRHDADGHAEAFREAGLGCRKFCGGVMRAFSHGAANVSRSASASACMGSRRLPERCATTCQHRLLPPDMNAVVPGFPSGWCSAECADSPGHSRFGHCPCQSCGRGLKLDHVHEAVLVAEPQV
jgi:hypothetical protein